MPQFPRLITIALHTAAVCLLATALLPREASALGLGEIVVKSSYNKGFVAEIPVFLDQGETELKAAVGTQADYNMIQIGRPAFIDGLSITVENGASGKVVVVRSKDPITQPSFNLIVRATASGGTVLENYFLAVDFRKSLSLDLPPPEAKPAEAPKPVEKPAPAVIPAPITPVMAPAPPPPPAPVVEQAPPARAPEPAPEPAPAPVVQEAAPVLPPPPAPMVEQAPAAPTPEPKQEPEAPVEVASAAEEPARSEPPPATAVSEPAAPGLIKTNDNPVKNRLMVKKGDSLFGIARSLHAPVSALPRVVVAIYKENKDAFIDGNIHRLRAGVTLNYAEVNNRASGITDEEARQLLSDDWKELQKTESAEPAKTPSVDLPFNNAPSEQELADFLEKWRSDWETNAPGFADLYAASFKGFRGHLRGAATKAEWIASRRAFNESHDNMNVAITDMHATRGSVSFTQTFTSDQLASTGNKSLVLTRENGELKIAEERFALHTAVDRTHKWTLVFPAVQSRELGIAHMQKLRGLGAVSYEASGAHDGPYIVAVGRFATQAQAEDFQTKLNSAGEVDAKVVLFPFSVRMKITEDPAAAVAAMTALTGHGYFPFKVETATAEGKTRHIVCVGAFAGRDEALKTADALKLEGFQPQPVIP